MNTPATSLPLPTDEQVTAWASARAKEVAARFPNQPRYYVQVFAAFWQHDTEPRVTIDLTAGDSGEVSTGKGKTFAEALANLDEKKGPAALLARVAKLRAEAAEIESKARALEAAAAPVAITDATLIVINDDAQPMTWREFVAANADGSSAEEIEAWRKELAAHGTARIGGGATAEFTLKLAA